MSMSDEQNQSFELPPDIEEEIQLTHADKLVGVFTEPTKTFEKMAKETTKFYDWFLPLLLLIVITNAAVIILMTNPQIKYAVQEKTVSQIQNQYDEMVQKGQMSKEQADEQFETIRDQFDKAGQGQRIIGIITSAVGIFIMFFIVSGVFFLFAKFALKGDGTYQHAMTAYGLPMYVFSIQWILIVIIGLTVGKMYLDTSVTSFMDLDKSTFVGFILSKLDLFSIWFYWLIAVAFAKLFKSDQLTKYVVMVFGVWLGFSVLFYWLGLVVPFIKFFTGNM